MKKVFIFVAAFLFCLNVMSAFALTMDDNGYAWRSASYEDKMAVCQQMAEKCPADLYVDAGSWYGGLEKYYSNDNYLSDSISVYFRGSLVVKSFDQKGQ